MRCLKQIFTTTSKITIFLCLTEFISLKTVGKKTKLDLGKEKLRIYWNK